MPTPPADRGGEFRLAMFPDATISPCGLYRYDLRRSWGNFFDKVKLVNFLMLNPSTADATADDPTIRKCRGFAERLDCTAFVVTNLFAWRSTDPRGVGTKPEHVGPENDDWILRWALAADLVVCAWGAHPHAKGRAVDVQARLAARGIRARRIGPTTQGGEPRHPLMLGYANQLEPMESIYATP